MTIIDVLLGRDAKARAYRHSAPTTDFLALPGGSG